MQGSRELLRHQESYRPSLLHCTSNLIDFDHITALNYAISMAESRSSVTNLQILKADNETFVANRLPAWVSP